MLALHAVQAAEGDCFILQYGGEANRFLLVDGGPTPTYEDLDATLDELQIERFELVVLTHVDDDHIGGLQELFLDVERGKRKLAIGALWHNAFSRTVNKKYEERAVEVALETEARSYRQGSVLAGDAETKLRLTINPGFVGGLASVETQAHPFLQDGLELRVAGPDRKALFTLRKKWIKWLRDAEKKKKRGGLKPDRSPTNLSSIVMLAKAHGKTLLLTGDSTHTEIVGGLRAAGLMKDSFHVDVLKVPHHGSNRNVTQEFFEQVTADQYVISADGEYGNPDPHTLRWIVDAAEKANRKIVLHVTNVPGQVQQLVRHKPPGPTYTLKTMEPDKHFMTIPIA